MQSYQFYQRTISPEEANLILAEKNKGNRPFRKNKISDYARAMREGKWRFTPAPLIFSDDESRLLDGQNRLAAVVESGIKQPFMICPNANASIMSAIDQGAARSPRDHLITRGIHGGASLAPLLLAIMSYAENPEGLWAKRSPASNEEYYDTYESNALLIDEAIGQGGYYNKAYRAITATDFAFIFYLLIDAEVPRNVVDDFLHKLSSGALLGESDPIFLYRKWLINNRDKYKGMRTRRQHSINDILKTYNAYRAGRGTGGSFRPAPLQPTPKIVK